MKEQASPYKILQTILEKIKSRNERARFSKNPDDLYYAIMDGQERTAEALLIVGTLLDTIVDKQLSVVISAPEKKDRN